jgi:hypothetical protein
LEQEQAAGTETLLQLWLLSKDSASAQHNYIQELKETTVRYGGAGVEPETAAWQLCVLSLSRHTSSKILEPHYN